MKTSPPSYPSLNLSSLPLEDTLPIIDIVFASEDT